MHFSNEWNTAYFHFTDSTGTVDFPGMLMIDENSEWKSYHHDFWGGWLDFSFNNGDIETWYLNERNENFQTNLQEFWVRNKLVYSRHPDIETTCSNIVEGVNG